MLLFDVGNPIMRAFGVRVERTSVDVGIEVRHLPTIHYDQKVVQVNESDVSPITFSIGSVKNGLRFRAGGRTAALGT